VKTAALRFCLCAAASLLVASCASVRHVLTPGETPQEMPAPAQYTSERDAAEVARMRAAPAPDVATISVGDNAGADANRMANEGYVRIGSGRYDGDEALARGEAGQQSRIVGADRVFLYAPAEGETTWLASYYVRFRLAFGATFRDLRPDERKTLGSSGVQIGSVVDGTPASRANLMSGDFVTAVNGRAIADKGGFQDALRANVGRDVMLTVVRNGEKRKRIVRLGGAAPAANAR